MRLLSKNSFACLAMLGAFLIAGCKIGPVELSGLVVNAEGIRAFASRGDSTEVTVIMRCHNETIRPIGIKSMELTLTLNGIPLGTARTAKPLATQSLSSNTLDVVFTLADANAAAQLKQALRSGALNYELKSRLTVFSADDEMRSTSTTTGTITVNPHLLNLDD